MLDWRIEPFAPEQDRANFTCGRAPLDDFLRHRVRQYEGRRLGKTFVAVPTGKKTIIGYYTIAAGSVELKNLPTKLTRKLPKHPIPVILLARLAVDQSAQGQRIGEGLLLDALQRSLDLSVRLGIYAVEVDALDQTAARCYQEYGFTPLLDDPLHLFLPLATIKEALG